MPREMDPIWKNVKLLPNKHWNCNFCGNEYAGSATRIKAHLAGVGGYGIQGCKVVNAQVRSEASVAMVELSNRPDNVEERPHQPVIASSEAGRRETSSATMLYRSSDTISAIGASSSSAFLPLNEMNVHSQYLPIQNMTTHGDFSSCTQPPQSHAGDSNIQLWNLSYRSSCGDLAHEALTNVPRLVNAGEGEPNTEVPQGASSSSAFLPLNEMNVLSQYLPPPNMPTHGELSSWTQPPQSHAGDSNIQPWNLSHRSSCGDLTHEALTNVPRLVNTGEGEPNTEVPQELSNGAEGNVEEGLLLPVTANSEDAWGEAAFDVMALLRSPPSDLYCLQQPQSNADGSYTQLQNFSYSDIPEALTNMPNPQNAEEGEPNTEVPRDARTKDAVMVSRPGNCGLVNENVPSLKRKWGERSNREVVNNCCYRSFRKSSMTHATRCRKSSPLLTTELVGKESKKTINKICDYLMEDENVIIGIYGMGGVGKTAILLHVQNRVLEDPTFNDVFWVTVPQEFSVYELQDEIANVVGLDDLLKYKDVKRRACILDKHLKKKERSILLLDGMWKHFEVKDVGIPIKKSGLKLVFTTWSLDVCHKMLCQKLIKIEPLSLQGDAWNLFLETLGEKEITSEVEKFARLIVQECGGLPLGIIEIATCMRRVEEVYEWKDMLRKLKESRVELDVFKRLKLCYLNLADSQVQQCFLNLTQKFENSQGACLNTSLLIESFIDEDLLDGTGTRQGLHECGNAILNKLRKGCLCEGVDQFIYLHPLIRGMALHMERSPTHMVETYMELKEIPKEKFWTDCLKKVSLQGNNIKEIPDGISPNCPELTRLSLNDNFFLEAIHKSFFKHLKGLEVLDLCQTKIRELPDTLSHLESLEALLLRGCKELFRIPCLQKLKSLRKLDLSGCAMLKEVPEGMEMLVKLSYLDLRGTEIETLSQGMLGKLVNLQYLAIGKGQTWLKGVLKKMEVFYCFISNVETFNACVRFLEQNSSLPYELWLNDSGDHYFKDKHERHIIIESCHSIAATVDGEIGGDGRALLPRNVQVLKVGQCSGLTSLSEVGPLNNLEELEIEEWEKLEELGAVHFPRLRVLDITRCTKLKHFLKEGHELRCLQWLKIEGSEELEGINIAAPFLYNIEVYECPKMKWVVKWQWLATRFPNLRSIKIKNCRQLEEIVGGLPPIGATCRLTKIEIEGCNNLKRLLMTRDMMDEEVRVELTIVEGLYCSVPNVETFNECVWLVEQNSSQPYDLALIASGNCFSRSKHERRRIIIESCHSIAATVDGEIGGDGRALLPRNVQVLKVGRCSGVTSLCEVGPLNNLEELEIKEWEKLEELGAVHFPRLQRLNITRCTKLKHFLKEGRELRYLQWFKIEDSEELEEINIAAPFLYCIEVYKCPKMKWVVKWQWLATHLPNLRSIKIKDCEQLEEIVGGLPPIGATCSLTEIEIEGCNNLKGVLMTHNVAFNLPFLQHVMVEDCMGIEVIIGIVPNMTQPLHLIFLTLTNLPELKTICEGTVSWLSIQYMRISECPKLKRLPLLDKGPCYDDDIAVDNDICIDELTWQSLEWDHSPFHPSLQHLARRYGVSNWHDRRICVRIESRDAITARVDVLIGGDGRNLLPRNVQVLEVGGGSGVTSLSEVGPLENLEELTIKNCEKLEELGAVHFPQLEGLDINCCSKLKRLSVEGQGLPHLRWFTIIGSEELEGIDLAAPNLNFMEVRRCHKMKRVVEWDWLTTRLPNLKSIGLVYCEKLKEIIGGPLPIGSTCHLTKISITRCNNMKGVLLTHDMLLHIPSLQDIRIEDCEGIEVIIGTAPNMTQPSFPKLTHLTLRFLPKLKRICDRMESCDHIQYIEIFYCPNLTRIPLRLHPLDNGLLSPPPSLGQIGIDDKETWQALEWDHPLAPISLEPFIEFIYDRWADRGYIISAEDEL